MNHPWSHLLHIVWTGSWLWFRDWMGAVRWREWGRCEWHPFWEGTHKLTPQSLDPHHAFLRINLSETPSREPTVNNQSLSQSAGANQRQSSTGLLAPCLIHKKTSYFSMYVKRQNFTPEKATVFLMHIHAYWWIQKHVQVTYYKRKRNLIFQIRFLYNLII